MIHINEVDSYEKFARSFWQRNLGCTIEDSSLMSLVRKKDKLEVAIAFSVEVSHLENPDNFRIKPVANAKDFWEQERRGCCGSWNSQVKTSSGQLYWIGCNYGH